MAILKLYYNKSPEVSFLTIDLRIRYRGRTYSKAQPFVVDTGAERTFIHPKFEKDLNREIGPLKYPLDGKPAQSILGTMEFNFVQGIKLFACDTNGAEHELKSGHNGGVSCLKRSWWKRKLIGPCPSMNILGRDILGSWLLCHDPFHNIQFLASGYPRFEDLLRQDPVLNEYFRQPILRQVEPSDIEFLDGPTSRVRENHRR